MSVMKFSVIFKELRDTNDTSVTRHEAVAVIDAGHNE